MGPKQELQLRVRVDLEVMAMKECSIFPEFQEWSLPVRFFRVIIRTFVGNGEKTHPSAEIQSAYSTATVDWVTISFHRHRSNRWLCYSIPSCTAWTCLEFTKQRGGTTSDSLQNFSWKIFSLLLGNSRKYQQNWLQYPEVLLQEAWFWFVT